MIRRLWATFLEEHFKLQRLAARGLHTGMEMSSSKRDRSELNKGVDGVAKPDVDTTSKVLQQRFNPITGVMEWVWNSSDYDYHQEIARSSYADMLHDTERNQKYYAAIIKAVEILRARGQRVQVLDIGTGTGLLSMMAAAEGADSVTACEAFEPMADCAETVMEDNGFGDQIKLVRARSTEIGVGEGQAMTERANLLVTEVFDTELIGEGAIGTYTHAHESLLQEDCLTVPRAANMYAQPVSSDYIRRWNTLPSLKIDNDNVVQIPAKYSQCGGVPSLHDLQLDQVQQTLFTPVCPPVKVFRFDFSKRGVLKKEDSSEVAVQAMVSGKVDAVFVWWDLEMDPEGEIILSCAPRWAHPLADNLPWREHWMQAIFYPPQCLSVEKGETFRLISQHDEYSLWFQTALSKQEADIIERPVCECGLHISVSRSRLAMMSDSTRNHILLSALKKRVNSSTVCLVISDGSLLSLMAAKLGAKQVFVLDTGIPTRRVLHELIKENKLEEKIVVLDKTAQSLTKEDFRGYQVDLVIAEPYFQSNVLPWDSLYYMYAIDAVRPYLSLSAHIMPSSITIQAMAMHFKDLWKIRAPVGLCEGFMLNFFDNMIKNASDIADDREEAQPLWEYPGRALSQPTTLMSVDLVHTRPFSTDKSSLALHITCQQEDSVNGVALWCDYSFDDDHTISTGPVHQPVVGQTVQWDVYSRQAVYLPHNPSDVTPGSPLDLNLDFDPREGKLKFDWQF